MDITLTDAEGTVRVAERDGRRALAVTPNAGVFAPVREWLTAYPQALIEHVLRTKGASYLCDEIMRDESPQYVQHCFRWDLLSYVRPEDLDGRRVLDFGSGSGASSMVLARMFPGASITGVELMPEYVELARHRARHYGIEDRVRFLVSPDPDRLPDGIGEFDYIVFSAVYEHLLPAERDAILGLLWSHLKPGGLVFLDQTPYRWFPIEVHTTGLPLLNYLPDALALRYARRCSPRVSRDENWASLLRKGIRGATTRGILATLNRDGRSAESLPPSQLGVRDHIDLWYRMAGDAHSARTKRLTMWAMRAIRATTGVTMVPSLSLAIRKLR